MRGDGGWTDKVQIPTWDAEAGGKNRLTPANHTQDLLHIIPASTKFESQHQFLVIIHSLLL